MTIILSWNIQNGKGIDGVISLERIASVIKTMCDPDVICLQEISRHLQLIEDGPAPDHIAVISALFPDYETIFGAAVEAERNGAKPLLEDALDECSIETFSPDVGADYRTSEGVADNPKKTKAQRSEDVFKIADILEPGYRLRNDETFDVVVPAKVVIFTSEETGE